MLTLFILVGMLASAAMAHPAVGIVRDSDGNIFYSDTANVWRIDPHGAKSIAVPNVHTHELWLDSAGNLYGEHLWYGSYDSEARLARAPLKGGPSTAFKLPPLTKDAVSFIAQNPARRDEYAIATFNRDVYMSKDAGRTWKAIAERGEAK